MSLKSVVENALERGGGVLRLAPAWVPRALFVAGRRIRLHPDDYFAYGAERGGIDERWLASTTPADNGPLTSRDEGLSAVVFEDGATVRKALLRDAVAECGADIVGKRIWDAYHCFPAFAKLFDNKGALPLHIHHREEHAALAGRASKPEAYYFPAQLNGYRGDFPYTFFGLRPGTTRDQLKERLLAYARGDNAITGLSTAYRLETGTGWYVPAGVLHAPGSLCTYEPQKASDDFAIYQSLTGDAVMPVEMLWKNTPPDKVGDVDYLIEVLDWEANVDPDFASGHFMAPVAVRPRGQTEPEGYREDWISYRSADFSAKELTVLPGRTVNVIDAAAYGCLVLQGHGRMGACDIEAPVMIRFSQLTSDELFVTEEAAKAGVVVSNPSRTDPLVVLKHFGPGNPDLRA